MIASAMLADRFWQSIERASGPDGDPDAHMEALRAVLGELSVEEILIVRGSDISGRRFSQRE